MALRRRALKQLSQKQDRTAALKGFWQKRQLSSGALAEQQASADTSGHVLPEEAKKIIGEGMESDTREGVLFVLVGHRRRTGQKSPQNLTSLGAVQGEEGVYSASQGKEHGEAWLGVLAACSKNSFRLRHRSSDSCRKVLDFQARTFKQDAGQHPLPARLSFRLSEAPAPHDFRGVSSEPYGVNSAPPGLTLSQSTPFQPGPLQHQPPSQDTPRKTLWYGAAAALLLSGGAVLASNSDYNPGQVLKTDPRAVMRSASQSVREAAHEARARVRALAAVALERWEVFSTETEEVTSSASALASCLSTVLWGPLEEVEEAHSKGRALLRARVAALIADFAANRERRNAIACAGGGKILGWLIEQVSREEPAVRNEAARALGHFLSDRRTAGAVLMQVGAIPQLIAYCNMLPRLQMLPPTTDRGAEEDLLELEHAHPGQRLLVASLSKIVAGPDVSSWTRGIHLSPDAKPDDISAALQEMRSFEQYGEEGGSDTTSSGGQDREGVQGIGIGVLGDTHVVGVQRVPAVGKTNLFVRDERLEVGRCKGELEEERRISHSLASTSDIRAAEPWSSYKGALEESFTQVSRISPSDEGVSEPIRCRTAYADELLTPNSGPSGLGSFLLGGESSPALDEVNLGGQLATWAVATWAAESCANRQRIAVLDHDGEALVAALRHPDPNVQFHAARAVKELAGDTSERSQYAAATWTPPLVGMLAGTLFHDPALPSRLSSGGLLSLTSSGAEALLQCALRSTDARVWLGEQGLGVLRRLALAERLSGAVQGPLSRLLEHLAKGGHVAPEELKLWTPILLKWLADQSSPPDVRSCATETLKCSIERLGSDGKLVMEAWLATLLSTLMIEPSRKGGSQKAGTTRGVLQSQALAGAKSASVQLEKVIAAADVAADVALEKRGWFTFGGAKKGPRKPVAEADVLLAVSNALKSLAELIAEDPGGQRRVLESGGYALLTQFLLLGHFTQAVSSQQWQSAQEGAGVQKENPKPLTKIPKQKRPYVKRHALRVLANLSIHPQLGALLGGDQRLVDWLEEVADGNVPSQKGDLKLRSFAKETLLHLAFWRERGFAVGEDSDVLPWPRFLDGIYLLDPAAPHFRTREERRSQTKEGTDEASNVGPKEPSASARGDDVEHGHLVEGSSRNSDGTDASQQISVEGQSRAHNGSRSKASPRYEQASHGETQPRSSGTAENSTVRSFRRETSGEARSSEEVSNSDIQKPASEPPGDRETVGQQAKASDGGDPAKIAPSQAENRQINGPSDTKAQLSDAPSKLRSAFDGFQSSTSAGRDADISSGLPPAEEPVLDVVFIHGLMGGPYKTWRMTEDKTSAVNAGGLDLRVEANPKEGEGCWPTDWLAKDLPSARLLSTEYKTNLTEWSGATLPLQELSAHLLEKLVAAGVGNRPVVFVTHSMGGLVAKQLLQFACSEEKYRALGESIRGMVFYTCPHNGSRLADLSSRMGVVLRPAAAVGELRSGSPRLEELNKLLKKEYQKGQVDVISFSEDKVTPVVEAYYGVKLRMEVVPIESAYPGFGDLIVLKGTDHVNACKPLNRQDVAYTKMLEFLKKMESAAKAT